MSTQTASGSGKAGQVVEVAVEAVGVVGVTIAHPLWRGGDDRNAALHLLRQPQAASAVVGRS